MTSSLTVSCQGRRFAAKITPMQPLSVVVEQVVSKLKPVPELSDCTLLANGKPIDTAVPFRFANLPSTAKLEITTGQQSSLGLQRQPAQADTQTAADPRERHTEADAASSSGAALGGYSSQLPVNTAAPGVLSSATVTAPPSTEAASSTLGQQAGHCPSTPQQAEAAALLGLDRPVAVFSRAELEAAAPAHREDELPDSFYDFGVEDYAKVMQGYSNAKARAESGLRTAKMRQEEEAARARRFPTAKLRIQFPDSITLQMDFQSADRLIDVRQSVSHCLLPQLATTRWHFFVTPPKKVLKDESLTLFQAGLCPAAILYFGGQGSGGPFLRPEVLALKGPAPNALRTEPTGRAEPDAPAASVAGEQPQAANGGGEEPARKVPKWLKLKK